MSSSYSSKAETKFRNAQIFDHLAELLHCRGTAGTGAELLRGMAYHIVQCRAVLDGKLHGGFDRSIANLAGRRVDDAAQTQLVHRIFDHPQIGEHVLEPSARAKKSRPLAHAVRNACADECGGNVIRQDVIAVQNGEISPFSALLHALADGIGNVGSFAFLAVRAMQTDFRTVTVVGPQLLALAADVVADNLVCSIENVAGRAVILFQTDGFRVLELLFKLRIFVIVAPRNL